MVMQAAPHRVEHRPAVETKEDRQFEDRKAATDFWGGGLGVTLLVFQGVRQLAGGSIHDFAGPALEGGGRTDPDTRRLGRGGQSFFQPLPGQSVAGLDVGRIPRIDRSPVVQAEAGLHLAHHLATGGIGREHLPEETFEGQAQTEDRSRLLGPSSSGDGKGAGRKSRRCCWSWARVAWRTVWVVWRPRAASRERKAGKQGVIIVRISTHYVDRRPLPVSNGRVKHQVELPPACRELAQQLAQLGLVSQGSVFARAPGQQGSRYVWTRKVKAETVTVALSEEQYHWLKQAVANQRKLTVSWPKCKNSPAGCFFENVPGVVRRKHLTKRVLGLN